MSVKVMTWVWDHSRSRGSDRLVLLAIADCASDDGSNAYPSMSELVRKTGLAERTVQGCVKSLVLLGELFVSANGGPRGCNRYRVITTGEPPQNLHPADFAPPPQILRESLPDQSQMWHVTPADSAPRRICTPQILRSTPAESAPGTVLNRQSSSTADSDPTPTAPATPSPTKPQRRGTRIPDDFAKTITPEMVAWAHANAPGVDGRRETAKFVDHFRAAPGQKGVKLDWPATWRNWMRNAAERGPGGRPAAPPSNAPAAIPAEQRCPLHRGELAGSCRRCAANAKARPMENAS